MGGFSDKAAKKAAVGKGWYLVWVRTEYKSSRVWGGMPHNSINVARAT